MTREKEKRWRERHPERAPQKKWEAKNPAHFLLIHTRHSARRGGHECTITKELIEQLLEPMVCSVTGHRLRWHWDGPGRNPWKPSIDRVHNDRGYTPDNVRIVSWIYNHCKSDWTDRIVMDFRGDGP